MKKLIVSLMVAIIALGTFSFVGCSKNEETYIIGYDFGFPPMGFLDIQLNKDVGFDLDLAEAVFNDLGYKFSFKRIDWSLKEQYLKSHDIDLIWNGYTITDARKLQVNFSIPYMKNSQCVVIKSNDNKTTIQEIKDADYKIAVQTGSSALQAMYESELLKSYATKIENDYVAVSGKSLSNDTNVNALNALESGEVEAFVTDYVLANYLINTVQNKGKFKILEESLADEQYGIGFRKEDTELMEKVNQTLINFKENGKLLEIANKWNLGDALIV